MNQEKKNISKWQKKETIKPTQDYKSNPKKALGFNTILENINKLSEKYAGKLPSVVATKLHKQATKSRNEWNKRDI